MMLQDLVILRLEFHTDSKISINPTDLNNAGSLFKVMVNFTQMGVIIDLLMKVSLLVTK